MNKIFKIVFNAARGKMMVVNEATSSVQTGKKAAVTVAVIGALASGVAMAADSGKVYEGLSKSNYGGAISSSSSLVLEGYAFTGNIAKGKEGTMYNGGQGGAIYSSSADLTVTGSSFNGNQAANGTLGASQPNVTKGGAIYHQYGQLEVTGSTFTANTSQNNGGAVAANGSASNTVVIIKDSLFGGEEKSQGNSTKQHGGAIHIQGSDTTLSGNTFTNNTAGGRGGAILFRDSAVAKFEGQNSFVGNSAGTNGGALNTHQSGAEVTFASGSVTTFENNTAVKQGGAIRNDDKVVFEAGSVATFVGNSAGTNGGAIANTDEDNKENPILKLEGTSTFEGNIASGNGGAILNEGTLTVNDATFKNNKANWGGAIYNVGKMTVADSVFEGNYSSSVGGAITTTTNSIDTTIDNVVFKNNHSDYDGGAIGTRLPGVGTDNSAAKLDIEAYFEGNSALENGGAIHNTFFADNGLGKGDGVTVKGEFVNNSAKNGGAIYNLGGSVTSQDGVMTIIDSTFTGNSASEMGGAIYNGNVMTFVGTNTFSDNTAGGVANDIYNEGTITLADGSVLSLAGGISGNGVLDGAGSIVVTDAGATIEGQEVEGDITASATGDVNDALGGDVSKLQANLGGVTVTGMEEGSVMGAVTVGADGQVTQAVNAKTEALADKVTLAPQMITRILMNDLRKRMGDVRAGEGTHGAWARYNGGQMSGDGVDADFHMVQVGIDTVPVADAPRFGVAFSYAQTESDDAYGTTDMDSYSLAAYATKMYDNGMFFDVIGRMATMDTDMVNAGMKGKMDNVALSLSGELGWRFDLTDSFFIEPSVEATYTYTNADKFTMSNGGTYELEATDSLVGRAGFAAGFKCPANKGDLYVRAAVVHEFMGDMTVNSWTANGAAAASLEADGKDTWFEYAIGANFNVNKNTYVYADIERTEGAAMDEDWRANVGVRFAF